MYYFILICSMLIVLAVLLKDDKCIDWGSNVTICGNPKKKWCTMHSSGVTVYPIIPWCLCTFFCTCYVYRFAVKAQMSYTPIGSLCDNICFVSCSLLQAVREAQLVLANQLTSIQILLCWTSQHKSVSLPAYSKQLLSLHYDSTHTNVAVNANLADICVYCNCATTWEA